MNKFKKGDKVRVIKKKRGVVAVGDTGVVLTSSTWKCDQRAGIYSLLDRFYDFEKIDLEWDE